MSDLTISISDRVLEKVRQLAKEQSRSIEDVVIEHLEGALLDIPSDEKAELNAMAFLSDDALFSLMQEQMLSNKQLRMSDLMNKNSLGTITPEEYEELSKLVDDGQRLTLRKATAMNILLDRGYQLTLDDMKPNDK